MSLKRITFNGKETNYMASSRGKIYSIKNKDGAESLYELKEKNDRDGYHRVTIYVDGHPYERGVHRLIAMAFIPNPENKPEVNHKDGKKFRNEVSNLEWVTTKENICHAWNNHLSTPKQCESHPNSVYTNEQIKEVCELISQNVNTMKEISDITKVSYTVVKQIKGRVIWNEISKDYDFSNYTKSRRTILTEKQVEEICEKLSNNDAISAISEKMGIPSKTIETIKDRRFWTRISKNYNW